MSLTSATAIHVIDVGTAGWCWSRLGPGGEGILSYEASRGRRSLAVPYTVSGQEIAIPLAPFNDAGWLAVGTEAQLEVTGVTPDDLRWVVRVTASAERANPATSAGLAQSRRMHPSTSAGHGAVVGSDRLALRTPRVRGFYETPVGSPTTSVSGRGATS